MQFLDIPGDGRLGHIVSSIPQLVDKILLGFHILIGNDLPYFDVPLRFHFLPSNPLPSSCSPCSFLRTTSKKSRSSHLIREVMCLDAATRITSSTSSR